MAKDIVVRLTKQVNAYPRDTELGFASEAKATKVLGDGSFKVIRYQSGEDYPAPKPSQRGDEPIKKGESREAS